MIFLLNLLSDPTTAIPKAHQPMKKSPISQSLDACISYERSPLKLLLEATITAFITTTHSRLSRFENFNHKLISKSKIL